MKPGGAVAVATLLVVGSLALAGGSPTPWLLPGDSVSATLAPGERKTVEFAGVEGSTLDVRATAPDGSRVVPRISVLAPDGVPAPVGDTNPSGGARARVAGLALGTSGVWRIGVETPAGRGGPVVLSTKARVPLRFAWDRTLAGNPDEFRFAAAPRGTVSIVVAAATFDPVVELVAPSGDVVATAAGKRGRATIAHAALPGLGRYTVRISGGTGAFTARAAVRPAPRRVRSFRSVESTPDIQGFSPATTSNQVRLTVFFDGVGFAAGQTVSLADATHAVVSGPVQAFGYAKSAAVLDLADVAPGTYTVRVATPDGIATDAPAPLVVTNLAPVVASLTPQDAAAAKPFPLDVVGEGFDTKAGLYLRRASDGAEVALAVTGRTGHEGIAATVSPAPYFTGECDLEVRDPDGGRVVVARGIDLLGYSAAPAAVRSVSSATPPDFYVYEAAYDETRGRVLVALREQFTRAVFVLVDTATLSVVDTLTIDADDLGGGRFDTVRVAWDGIGDTFALCLCSTQAPAYGVLRVVSAADIRQTVVQTQLTPATSDHMSRMQAAANRDSGGYLVVWDQFDAVYGRRIRGQAVAPDGTIDTATQTTVAWSPDGNLADPVVAWQRTGRFVAAWASLSDDGFGYAVRAAVTDSHGEPVAGLGPYSAATSRSWGATARPELALSPADGSMLLAFWYLDGVLFRPAAQRLAPQTASPSAYARLDDALPIPGGGVTSVAWNAARAEFVVVVVTYSNRVTLRRVNADGSLRPAPVVESYEGTSGVLYSGDAPGAFGLARGTDGVDDDVHDAATTTMRAVVAPIR